MNLIIAEKPSVGKTIAQVLKATNSGSGYIEGNGYIVTWAYGHLVQLAKTSSYGVDIKSNNNLPLIPSKFILALNSDPGAIKQFNIIKDLIVNKATNIIIATDAGREGELIFRYIYNMIGCQRPLQRLWISSLTNSAIEAGFKSLRAGSDFDNLYHAASARSEADWIVGINSTILFTRAAHSPTILSLGRVQTPVLAMICKRFLEHTNFVEKLFYVPTLTLNKMFDFEARYEQERIFDIKEAHAKFTSINNDDTVTCTSAVVVEKEESQPLLFDLTTLQADANRLHNLSAQNTLDIAQKLYESKIITYPRTDSRYITDDVYAELPKLMQQIKKQHSELGKFIDLMPRPLPKKSVNNNKVSDHHAILPTGEITGQLDDKSTAIFNMILTRSIAAFMPLCKKELTTYSFNDIFISKGAVIKESGWRAVENNITADVAEKDDVKLPLIKEGESIRVVDKTAKESKTKPPSIHSESSLLKLMETAGKEIEDQELSKAIKDRGIGTPATRASIIEILFKRGYTERKKNKLYPTKLGLQIYERIKSLPLADIELTGEWEFKLNLIASGEYSKAKFISEISELTHNLKPKLLEAGSHIDNHTIKAKCPKCKLGDITESQKAFSCSNWEKGCTLAIWKIVSGKRLSLQHIEDLITKGKTGIIKGFIGKDSKKSFDAVIALDADFKMTFVFNQATALKCPKCKVGAINEMARLFACEAESCDFKIWKSISKKNITLKIAQDLIKNGKTLPLTGFKSKTNKSFKASLYLKEDFTIGMKF
ncbi:MAG TPA: DNA topoisomerase III [Cyclobacteriaceae bacterium]|nr:DNA topoisomerase III [Cyclobacteriaceae bacterium]